MPASLLHLRLLLFRLALVYAGLAVCRLLFYCYNADAFSGLAWGEWIGIFFYALRFDTCSVLYVNVLLILLHLLPIPYRGALIYYRIQKAVFYIANIPMFFLELSDVVYFPYSFRRMNLGDFGMKQDIKNLIPQFLSDFWWLVLVLLLLIVFWEWSWQRSRRWVMRETAFLPQIIIFVLSIPLVIIGMRGGLQVRPLMPQAAAKYVSDVRYMPLVSNTTLGLIHAFQQKSIQSRNYFNDNELNTYYTLNQNVNPQDSFRRLNVVVLVVESFGREYIGYFHPEKPSNTPFFDSLLRQGLLFENMYANGTRSTQGIVAIAGGFPALMPDPFMFSSYQSNKLMGMGNILGEEGYQTGFFHPGEVGTMDFDKFAPLAGYQHYYGRRQYIDDSKIPENQDYDGNWGVWDIPFYDYTLHTLNEYRQPFLATVFSINPHHPFNVPPDFEARYPQLPPLQRAVRYADAALAHFFAKAQQQSWFQNTLFVITADHVGPIQTPRYYQSEARYRIPLLLFCPSDSSLRGTNSHTSQQIDILPTVLGYLRYNKPYRAFGKNKLDSTVNQHFVYTFEADIYQIIDSSFVLQFDGEQSVALYQYKTDTLLKNNTLSQFPQVQQPLQNQLKAVIQTHNRVLLNNEFMSIKIDSIK